MSLLCLNAQMCKPDYFKSKERGLIFMLHLPKHQHNFSVLYRVDKEYRLNAHRFPQGQ